MNQSIAILLELQVIDQRRQSLRRDRDQKRSRVADAAKSAEAARLAAETASAEVERHGALIRQYSGDAERCDATIADLRAKQMAAKTNKDYMAIINGIEQAKSEKAMRENSIKELTAKVDALKDKAAKAKEQADQIAAKLDQSRQVAGSADEPGADEQKVQADYDALKVKVDPAFLDAYERLVKANHRMPLCRVDANTRATPHGALLSHNQVEQIRMGKLVIDRTSNSILYIGEAAQKA